MPIRFNNTSISAIRVGSNVANAVYVGSTQVFPSTQPPTFSPSDITGLRCWLDASQETTYVNGQSVTTVSDFSGNSLDFTGTGVTFTTNALNTNPVFTLASTALLENASNSNFNFLHSGDNTVFMVMNLVVSGTERCVIYSNNNGSIGPGNLFFVDNRDANSQNNQMRMIVFANSNRPVDHNAEPYALQNQYAIIEVSHELSIVGGSCYFQQGNQAQVATTSSFAASPNNAASTFKIGQQLNPFGFDVAPQNIAEIIFYDKILTSQETTDVRTYLNTKWSLS